MIAITKQRTDTHEQFVEMLPLIRRLASSAFRNYPATEREELIAEAVANAFVAFQRLVERGKEDLAYATPLAMFAIRQIRDGRRVGSKLNVRDVSSRHCQRRKGCAVERLDRYDHTDQGWREIVVEDRQAGPADTAAMRLDFAEWLKSLSRRQRCIAETLAEGETTKETARKYRVSPARISQIRKELREGWLGFQGELPGKELSETVAAPSKQSISAINRSLAVVGETI